MRTLYALFALFSLALVALVATAASANPTLSVDCTRDASNNCIAGTVPNFSGGGLNMHKSYAVEGTSLANGSFSCMLTSVDKQGNYSEPSCDGFLLADTWTFTLWQLDHSGNLNTQIDGPYTFIFE